MTAAGAFSRPLSIKSTLILAFGVQVTGAAGRPGFFSNGDALMGSDSLAKRVSHHRAHESTRPYIQCFQYVQWYTDSGSPSSIFKAGPLNVANKIAEGVGRVDHMSQIIVALFSTRPNSLICDTASLR